jgi:hypothetical protein
MELAYAFRSTLETLPNVTPYLPLEKVDARAAELATLIGNARLRVGLLWAASEWDSSRSIPIDLLKPLACAAGVEFFSLQQGAGEHEWSHAPFQMRSLSVHTRDVVSAAAAMSKLDLIITVDSMAAHLAGAFARPVWVLLQHASDWRWMKGRADSPWYPRMRLFRQREPGNWGSAVQELAAALRMAAQSSPPLHLV